MTDIRRYLRELGARAELLHEAVEKGTTCLARRHQVDRLEELAARVRRWQASCVVDRDAPFLLRPARAWAVIGPEGIPDDVQVVGEAVFLFGKLGEVSQPNLEEYRGQGRRVLSGQAFLEHLAWLKEEVLAGRRTLPHHLPRRPIIVQCLEGSPRPPAEPEQEAPT